MEQVAERTGLAPSTVSRLLSGGTGSMAAIALVAQAVGVHDELVDAARRVAAEPSEDIRG